MLSCLPRRSQTLRILVQPAKDSRRRDAPPRGYPGGYGPPGAYPPYGYPPPGFGRPAPRIRRGKSSSSLPSSFPDLKALTKRPHHPCDTCRQLPCHYFQLAIQHQLARPQRYWA